MKKPRTYILEEDQHLENLRKIIKRDYFSSGGPNEAPSTTLNHYLANFTSKQNKIFSELVHIDQQQWKKEHWWIDKEDKIKMITDGGRQYRNMLEGNRQQNGINTYITQQQGLNGVFFKKDKGYTTYLTEEQQAAKKIIYSNCRLPNENNSSAYMQVKQQMLSNQGQQSNKKSAHEPIITWGQIQSTPLRLNGSQYKIPETPIRDQLLDKLNQKIYSNKKLEGKRKSQFVLKILGTVTPSRSSYRVSNSSVRRQQSEKRQSKQSMDSIMEGLLKVSKK